MNTEYSNLVIISAPSGCGKDTIIEKVCQRLSGIGVSISCTTRKARKKKDGTYEQHGVDYFFIESLSLKNAYVIMVSWSMQMSKAICTARLAPMSKSS